MERDWHDSDIGKGALEQDDRSEQGNSSMSGQLPHRTQDRMIKDADSDFPEPGNNPEHSGEPDESADAGNE